MGSHPDPTQRPPNPADSGGSTTPAQPRAAADSQLAEDICPRCAESVDLALIKGCLRCMRCGFKWDCNGW